MELLYNGYLQCERKGDHCFSVYSYSMHNVLYLDDILSSILLLACDIYEYISNCLFSILYFASLSIQAFVNVSLKCHIFDRADKLSVLNIGIVKNNYVSIKNLRSRYDKFVIGHYCVHVRDREPSRPPVNGPDKYF